MKNILVYGFMLVALSACSLHANPNKARINVPGAGSVVIDADNAHQEKFCPPGQAKKGRC